MYLLTVHFALRNDKNTSMDHLDGNYSLPCSYCITDAIPLRDDQRKVFLPRCWFLPMPSHFLVPLRSAKWWGNTQCLKHNGVLAVYDCIVFFVSGNSTFRHANPTLTWTENPKNGSLSEGKWSYSYLHALVPGTICSHQLGARYHVMYIDQVVNCILEKGISSK